MDGETARAMIAAQLWSAGTTTERKKPARDFLATADDLLKRSTSLGSPYASDSVDVVLVDASAYSAVRFREWLSRQTEDVKSLYAGASLFPPAP